LNSAHGTRTVSGDPIQLGPCKPPVSHSYFDRSCERTKIDKLSEVIESINVPQLAEIGSETGKVSLQE
jgi:hypothetical protein